MSWLAFCGLLLLATALLLVPGLLVGWAAGLRGPSSVLLAPVLSVGTVSGAAILMGALGIPFTPVLFFAVTAVACLLTLGGRLLLRRVLPDGPHEPAPASPRLWGAIAMGVALNVAVVWWLFLSALASPDGIIQTYDTPFHFSVITYLHEQANGSSIGSALVDRTVGSSFYPAAWHDMVLLALEGLPAPLPAHVNASIVMTMALAWPLSVMALTHHLRPGRPLALLAAGALASLFSAFPVRYVVWGVLYSNLLSWAVLPGAMVLFTLLWSSRGRDLARSAFLFVLAFVGVALAQPNGVFTAWVLLTPFLVAQVWALCRTSSRPRLTGTIAVTTLLVSMAGLWLFIHRLPFMARTVTHNWPAHTDLVGATKEILTGATNGMPAEPVMTSAALVAAATWLVLSLRSKDRPWWPSAAFAITIVMYIIGSGVPSKVVTPGLLNHFRDVLTGFWYHDQFRLAAMPVLVAVPLVAVLVDDLADALARALTRTGRSSAEDAPTGLVAPTVALTSIAALVAPTLVWGVVPERRASIHNESVLAEDRPLTVSELEFMHRVKDFARGRTILNHPFDASVYGYSLVGLNLVYRSYQWNWIGSPTADQTALHTIVHDVATRRDEVCTLLERNDVSYVLVMRRNATSEEGNWGLTFDGDFWAGLDIRPDTPGFTPVLSDERGDVLYEVSACR
ncbi:hypothetical protein I6B53_04145 [Schaalia sp. 19OD2882]|uniref:DUF6541 family protein n=1 Tax=Schaalia sp. 19OD2882 TaxID=2794089 RepID=UPI001C1EC864|nr:DUF6541 family protein [Schaalia sp. 19OD2882]QWW20290.1 hypothetical protein I6B53_04145 [Schaalia sp. 19OD2882]